MKRMIPVVGSLLMIFSAFSSAESTVTYDLKLQVDLVAYNGQKILIKGPGVYSNATSAYEFKAPSIMKSPDGRYVAVHYIGYWIKYWAAYVYLVDPNGGVQELAEDEVRSISWASDSRHLMGFGDNTFRLWSVSGTLKKLPYDSGYGYVYRQNVLYMNSGSAVKMYHIPSLEIIKDKNKLRRCN